MKNLQKNSNPLVMLFLFISSTLFISCGDSDDNSPTVPTAPTVTSINPTSGAKGTVVRISGTNFGDTNNTQVFFNTIEAVVQTVTETTITVLAPEGSTGLVKVISKGTELIGQEFTYISTPHLSTNEPKGMTKLAHWNGTSKSLTGWGKWGSAVEVIDDSTNPIGTGKALQFNYEIGSNSAGALGANKLGAYNEYYIMYRIFYDSEWEFIGHKNFYWGIEEGSRHNIDEPTQYYATFESNGDARVKTQNGISESLVYMKNQWKVGEWVSIEIHAVAESVPGAGDGKLYYYFNHKLTASNEAVQWTLNGDPGVKFDGFWWYAKRNNSNTKASWFKIGELYISGKD